MEEWRNKKIYDMQRRIPNARLSILSAISHRINTPKRYKLAEWINNDPMIFLSRIDSDIA